MSRSLSILIASPNIAMYCARLANCHMLRNLCNVLGVSECSSVSISLAARLRAGMVMERAVGDASTGGGAVVTVVLVADPVSRTVWTVRIAENGHVCGGQSGLEGCKV